MKQEQNKKHRVAVTGIGLVNPLGNDTNTVWNNLIAGKSGISFLPDNFWGQNYKEFPYNLAGLVKNEQEVLNNCFDLAKQRKSDRFIHLAMIAGHQAIQDSKLTKDYPENRTRFGCILGVGVGGIKTIEDSLKDLISSGPKKVSPFLIPRSISNQAAGWLSMDFNLQGQIGAMVNACSSSADALGFAFRTIRDGYADYMLSGGAESCVTQLAISAFGNMRALCSSKNFNDPTKASRPFDKDREGFVLSEGAAILVLERLDLAQARNAKIYGEIIGYGATADAYHITAMHPEGLGAQQAITIALDDANINLKDIGYINAHGTSTQMNDKLETLVLKKVFGSHVSPDNINHAHISSTKSMTGHLLGAAGATEAVFSILALKNQILPPTINLENQDPECDLDYVANNAIYKSFDYAISNSFGFGGGNSVLVFKKF